MSRSGGFKCYNIRCKSCVDKTLCGEPDGTGLICVNRIVAKETNADRIRAMSDEELADFLDKCEGMGYSGSSVAKDKNGHCVDMLDWLRQPAEED